MDDVQWVNHSPNRVTIDLSAVVHNLGQVRKLLRKQTKIMGVVKSDAYGHGLLPVSRILVNHGIDCLGVAHLHEAAELRDNGIQAPIILLCGIRTKAEACEVVDRNLIPTLFDLEAAEILARESAGMGKRTAVHLKVDTGMGRLGISHGEIEPFLKKIQGFHNLLVEGLMSHLSSADDPEREFTEHQIRNFARAIQVGRSMGLELPWNNLANSAGIMTYDEAQFGLVRPGIMLYGGLPSPGFISPVSLKGAMRFHGRILQIRHLPDGTPVSYGRTYYTRGPRCVAIVSAGYGDGLPRSISNRGSALVNGTRAPLLGTVCMNLTLCDITGLEGVRAGDEVVFLGSQGGETIRADDIALWAESISYEVLCSIGQRNRKEYLQ